MKKLLVLASLVTVLGTATYANTDGISASLKALDNTMKQLEQREKARFVTEEKKAEISKQNYATYTQMINETSKKLASLQNSMGTSFFQNEYKQLTEKFSALDRQIRGQAAAEEQKINEFEQLKSILGY